MEKPKSNSAKRKVEEECKLLPLCRAKPSPSFIHLPATNPATCQNNQSAKLQTGVDIKKPQDCLGLLECMHANLQLQTKLAQQQMAILEDLQSSMTLLIPGGEVLPWILAYLKN
ncbi:TSSK6-activating co-chaperone protein [Sarcophilus harrisii]